MAKVSIVIPVYNVEEYIEKCARSLFEQTLDDIEYIFIDDCSPDKSIEVVKKVLKDYPNRKKQTVLFKMQVNSGLPTVRKQGIMMATGEYIIHCDSDDTIEPEMAEMMYNTAVNGNYDLVTCEIDWSNGYQMPFVECKDKIELIKAILTGNVIESVCTKMARKRIYETEGFIYTKDNVNEDCVFSCQIAYYAKSFIQLPNKFYHYYQRTGSLSHVHDIDKVINNFNQFKRNVNLIEGFLGMVNILEQVKSELNIKKLSCKNFLIQLTNKKKYKKLWSETYPEISGAILFNKHLPLRSKLVYYCVKYNMYNALRPIFTRHND